MAYWPLVFSIFYSTFDWVSQRRTLRESCCSSFCRLDTFSAAQSTKKTLLYYIVIVFLLCFTVCVFLSRVFKIIMFIQLSVISFYRALCVSAVFAVVRCLSITSVHSIQSSEDIVKLICRPGSPIILVFDPQCQ